MNHFSLVLKWYIAKDLNLKASFFWKSNFNWHQQKTMRIVKYYVLLTPKQLRAQLVPPPPPPPLFFRKIKRGWNPVFCDYYIIISYIFPASYTDIRKTPPAPEKTIPKKPSLIGVKKLVKRSWIVICSFIVIYSNVIKTWLTLGTKGIFAV